MHLERILQISVAALVALSTVLLGMGEQRTVLPLAACIVAFASVYVTDIQGWIRLNPRFADLLGLVAVALALVQWQREATDAGLIALLNFVVYVQFVLQLKEKNVATYWLLIALSLMEAAVSTALNESLGFGILLLMYVVGAIGVLTIFYMYREQIRATGGAADASSPVPGKVRSTSALLPSDRPGQELVFVGHVNRQLADRAANLPLVRLIGNLGGLTLGMACVVFVIVPRPERGAWREGEGEPTQRVVGFSNVVTLGELGAIGESHEEIMQVSLNDPDTGQPVELLDEPLFRGVVLTSYEDRKWKQELFAGKSLFPERLPAGVKAINQRFDVRPLDTNVLFSIYPAVPRTRRADILWSESAEQFSRAERGQSSRFEYELLTTSIVDRRPSSLVAARRLLDEDQRTRLCKLPAPRNGADPLAGTKALAERIVRVVPPEDHLERARILTNYLRDPTNFSYTLGEVRRDQELDPVEDFLTRHPLGHCEYFASALTLMLRSVGVPARLAIGFKGGDWTGTHYQVRAMHAHAWVEAYLAPECLPAQLPPGVDRANGAWLVLDPTAGVSAGASISAGSYVMEGLRRFVSSLRDNWRTYVLGLNHSRQQEGVYEPVREMAVTLATGLVDPEERRAFGRAILERLTPSYWGLTNGGWFSWRGALAAIVIMLAGLATYYGARFVVRRVWRLTTGASSTSHRGAAEVEFYRRLEMLLAARDLQRAPSQTPREFALAVGGQLTESAHTKRAAPLARQLAELFYRVRFGRRPLDTDEAATVEMALSELAGALALGSGRAAQDRR